MTDNGSSTEVTDASEVTENLGGRISALTFGVLQFKPKFTKPPTEYDTIPSPYYRSGEDDDDSVASSENAKKINSEASGPISLALDENLNMLTYDIKNHAPLFYLTQKQLHKTTACTRVT